MTESADGRNGKMTARRVVGVLALLAVVSLAGGARTSAAETRLKFIAWNFQVETVKEFLAQFEAENPDIKVDMEVIPSAQFAAKIQLMKNANTPFDAL
jgi:ABC-type glycerol-3-phosphate transport system substrate-binding protein